MQVWWLGKQDYGPQKMRHIEWTFKNVFNDFNFIL